MFYKIVSEKDFEYFYKWLEKDWCSVEDWYRFAKYKCPDKYPCLISYKYHDGYNGEWDHFDFTMIYQDEKGEWDLKIKENWGDMKEESEES